MHILKSVEIGGFRGRSDFSIEFHRDVNFLIGVNGSGKTTAINLIAAALNADFHTLDKLPFQKIRLQLQSVRGPQRPVIEVEKRSRPNIPFPSITFKIQDQATAKPVAYSLDEFEQKLIYRDYPTHRFQRDALRRSASSVLEHVKRLRNVSWLSIHRSEGSRTAERPLRDERYDSSVDRKLDQLSTDFVKYFSLLAKLGASEAARFQKTVFLSLIHQQTEKQLFRSITKLNLDEEKAGLVAIFREFQLDDKEASASIQRHFQTLAAAVTALEERKGLSSDHLTALVGMWRIHAVVQKWVEVVKKQEEIYQPRETFLAVLNGMLQQGKRVSLNDKNELEAVMGTGERVGLSSLSSGEKQLIIILGEALLQEASPWIYIADEPELSLHLTWQEQLVRNLRSVNPNAQIIFATHSPDIVSSYSDRVFDMENLVA